MNKRLYLTLYLTGPLVPSGHTVEAEGSMTLGSVKKQISFVIEIAAEDFEMVHGGEVMGDMNMLVSGTALCEGDEVVIEPSRRFIAGQRLREMGVEATLDDLCAKVLESNEIAGTDEEKARVVALMVEHEPRLVDLSGRYGGKALHFAADKGCLAAAQVLVSYGAKINAISEWRFTALQAALWAGHFDVARYLISMGAEVDMQNQKSDPAFAAILA